MTQETQVQTTQADEGAVQAAQRPEYVPATDIVETEDGFLLVSDMPGVDSQSLDVEIEDDVLTVEGRTAPFEPEGMDWLFAEKPAGDYRRRFTIPSDVDRSGIEAKIANGVLRVTLPKAEHAKPRKIEVQAG
jgi:HSP20 family molecular chaperone IbpA